MTRLRRLAVVALLMPLVVGSCVFTDHHADMWRRLDGIELPPMLELASECERGRKLALGLYEPVVRRGFRSEQPAQVVCGALERALRDRWGFELSRHPAQGGDVKGCSGRFYVWPGFVATLQLSLPYIVILYVVGSGEAEDTSVSVSVVDSTPW